jgi:hypothetical protein
MLTLVMVGIISLHCSLDIEHAPPNSLMTSSRDTSNNLIADDYRQREHEDELRRQDDETTRQRARADVERTRNLRETHDEGLPARNVPTFLKSF